MQCSVPLKPFTTLNIGGPAEFLIEAQHSNEIVTAFKLARELDIPIYFLAGCSNVLIDDKGLQGLVIINRTDFIEWNPGGSIDVAGGFNLDRFVYEVSKRNLADLTFAAGIPGSLGGALAGGAGAFGHLVHEYLISAEVLRRDGSVYTAPAEKLGIGYRKSELKERGEIILTARMGNFFNGDAEQLLREVNRIKAEREIKHPGPDFPSAGSFFKNLSPQISGDRRIPTGKLLEEAGAKELRVGDAGVFHKHANIVVNYGNATSAQVNELANQMAECVKQKFGIDLEREVQYLC